ncbi:ABC transporter C family member 13-like [Seriola lalandi dorsalis]|uniref:ABC transporter C family member 13-like n=1 Tax=Seriola lalandi dorsalis TaxID=1841481 RepID=UPI000C6F4931|nr:ABC transporter C family member 13-like [Seriola lalandi dorsalis]
MDKESSGEEGHGVNCKNDPGPTKPNTSRAVYQDAHIYLLDDPLSAVDAEVGKHLFEQCICGRLKNKCGVLVAHQLQHLRAADQILVMKEGHVTAQGSYSELCSSDPDTASMPGHTVVTQLCSHSSESNCTHQLPVETVCTAAEDHRRSHLSRITGYRAAQCRGRGKPRLTGLEYSHSHLELVLTAAQCHTCNPTTGSLHNNEHKSSKYQKRGN